MRSPVEERKYLSDPNYYRLGYQLAAQLLHSKLAQLDDPPPENTPGYARRSDSPDAVAVAEEVLGDTLAMLAWYRDRVERARWWRLWVGNVQPHERRLMTFLARTVEPCIHLIIAAALHEVGSGERAQRHVDPVMERAARNELSYRAYYSLACSHGLLADAPRGVEVLEVALGYLHTAFSMAPQDRGFDLAEWAVKDPSLAHLRNSSLGAEFQGLIEHFRRPESPTRPAPAA